MSAASPPPRQGPTGANPSLEATARAGAHNHAAGPSRCNAITRNGRLDAAGSPGMKKAATGGPLSPPGRAASPCQGSIFLGHLQIGLLALPGTSMAAMGPGYTDAGCCAR